MLSQIEVLDRIPKEEISIMNGCIKKYNADPEKMIVEDLCAMERLSEEKISDLLKQRLRRGDPYTFAGDVLISLNSNELPTEFSRTVSKIFCVFYFLFSFSFKAMKNCVFHFVFILLRCFN